MKTTKAAQDRTKSRLSLELFQRQPFLFSGVPYDRQAGHLPHSQTRSPTGQGHIVLFVAMCALMVWVTGPISADRTTAEYNALLDRIQETEQLPVIVTLDLKTPFQPEGRLSTTAVQAQRTAIATAQAELSQQLLPYGARIYVEYEVFSLLAVVVDEAAPRFLTTSPLVTSIEGDVAVPVALLSSTAVIGAPATWSQGYDGSGWTVVVLDHRLRA